MKTYIVKTLTRDHVYNFRLILSTQKYRLSGISVPVSAKKISAISVAAKTNIGRSLIIRSYGDDCLIKSQDCLIKLYLCLLRVYMRMAALFKTIPFVQLLGLTIPFAR